MRSRLIWIALLTSACGVVAATWGAPGSAAIAAVSARTTPVPAISATTLPALPQTPAPLMTAPPPSAPTAPPITAPPGSLIQITGAVANPVVLTLKDLQAMPNSTLTMRILDPDGRRRFHIFTGPLLSDVLDRANPTTSTGVDMATHAFVLVTGTSGASAIVAFAEFNKDYNAKRIVLAFEEDGRPLPGNGISELIVPEDATQGRFIMGVTTIDVGTP
jgi:DMSO/TMAO reductase YedYZ molybdopterin-dependent catalytic subunit